MITMRCFTMCLLHHNGFNCQLMFTEHHSWYNTTCVYRFKYHTQMIFTVVLIIHFNPNMQKRQNNVNLLAIILTINAQIINAKSAQVCCSLLNKFVHVCGYNLNLPVLKSLLTCHQNSVSLRLFSKSILV